MTSGGVPEVDPDDLTEDGHDFLDRYAETGDPADLRRACMAYEQALAVLPPDEETWPFLSNLGNCLRMVHEESGDTRALHRAAGILEDALRQVREGTEDYALVADNLALALRDGAAATGDRGDLQRAVDLHQAAVAGYATGPSWPGTSAISAASVGAVPAVRRRGEPEAGGGEHRAGGRRHPAAVARAGEASVEPRDDLR